MAKKKLSLFTQTIFNLVFHRAGNGYPKCLINERRRIPKEDLEKMEYVEYDSPNNGTSNYEIYRTPITNRHHGDTIMGYRYYNYRGREVKKNQTYKKVGKGRNATWEEDPTLPKWIEVDTHWSKQDIEEYVDSLGDDVIKQSEYWYLFPSDEVEPEGLMKTISTIISDLISFQYKWYEEKEIEAAVVKMKEDYEKLVKLICDVEEKDAGRVKNVLLPRLNIQWSSQLSSYMDRANIYDGIRELRNTESLRIKEVRFEYKKRLVGLSDDRTIAQAMKIEDIVNTK